MLDKIDAESKNYYIQFFIIDILKIYHISKFNQTFSLFRQKYDLIVLQFKYSSAKQNQLHSDICIILHLDIIFSKRLFMRFLLLMISQSKMNLISSLSIQIFNFLQIILNHLMYIILDQL